MLRLFVGPAAERSGPIRIAPLRDDSLLAEAPVEGCSSTSVRILCDLLQGLSVLLCGQRVDSFALPAGGGLRSPRWKVSGLILLCYVAVGGVPSPRTLRSAARISRGGDTAPTEKIPGETGDVA